MTESRSWVACGQKQKEEINCKGVEGNFWSDENILCGGSFMDAYTCQAH